jgi:hypothetical protein
VTVNRLIDYDRLPELLAELGFDAVTFSYPRREPFGSTSLVFSMDSSLVAFGKDELIDALDKIKALRKRFPVMNPIAGVTDIQRHIRGEEEVFACVGGHKYFYLDWNLDIWRCEAWAAPMGSVFELDRIPDQRDRCTACMMSCYRDTSVLMHAGIAVGDAAVAIRTGQVKEAGRLVIKSSVAISLLAVAQQAGTIRRLAGSKQAASRQETMD